MDNDSKFVAVDKDGTESLIEEQPVRCAGYWGAKHFHDITSQITLPKGSIKKLIGRELTWDDEAVELKSEESGIKAEQKKAAELESTIRVVREELQSVVDGKALSKNDMVDMVRRALSRVDSPEKNLKDCCRQIVTDFLESRRTQFNPSDDHTYPPPFTWVLTNLGLGYHAYLRDKPEETYDNWHFIFDNNTAVSLSTGHGTSRPDLEVDWWEYLDVEYFDILLHFA